MFGRYNDTYISLTIEVPSSLPFKTLTDSEFVSEFLSDVLPFSSYQDNCFDIHQLFDEFNEFANPDIFHNFSASGLNTSCDY